jgi:hypothetical protein
MKQETADQLAREWYAAWNAHELDEILAHYADDVEFISPIAERLVGAPDGVIRGKAQLRAYFEKGLATYPSLRFEPMLTLVGCGSIVLHYRSVNDVLAAEMMEVGSDGLIRRVRAHYCQGA